MRLNQYLKWSVLSGLFLTLFVPLITSSSLFFPFITGKNFAFRIAVEIIAGLWFILALRDGTYRPKISWILKAFLIFLGIMAVADLISPNSEKSFWSNFERMEGYVTLFHLFLYFVVSSSILETEKLWTRFLQTSLAVSVLASIYGTLQLLHKVPINQGGVRLDSTFGNATYFSVYLMFHVFFALLLLLRSRLSKTWQWIYGAVIIFELFIIYHTATRGVFLGLVVAALVMAAIVALFETERKALRKASIISIGAMVVLVAIFFSLKNTNFIKTNDVLGRFSSIDYNEAKPRLYVWNMAFQAFKERPILGWGQESFNYAFNKYYDPRMYTQEQWFDRSHDVFFDWLIAGGILGLLAYLSLFATVLYYIWKGFHFKNVSHRFFRSILEKLKLTGESDRIFSLSDRAILTGLLAAYFFQNIFVFDNLTSYIPFIIVLAFVHQMKGKKISAKLENRLSVNAASRNKILIPIVLIGSVFAIYFINAPGIHAGTTLINALRPQKNLGVNLDYYQKALSYNSFGNAEIREQLAQAAINALNSSADNDTKQKFFNLAQSELQKQIDSTPQDARYELFMGTFLSRFRLFDDAQIHLDRALALSPHKQTILFEVGSNLINKGNYAAAVDSFKKAYDLELSNTQARDFYILSLIYAGKNAEVDKMLIAVYGSTPISSDQIIKAFADTKQYARVISIWKVRLAENPDNSQGHTSLAAAYLQSGDRVNAVLELQKAIQLNPDFKTQGEYYISEIKAGRNP